MASLIVTGLPPRPEPGGRGAPDAPRRAVARRVCWVPAARFTQSSGNGWCPTTSCAIAHAHIAPKLLAGRDVESVVQPAVHPGEARLRDVAVEQCRLLGKACASTVA